MTQPSRNFNFKKTRFNRQRQEAIEREHEAKDAKAEARARAIEEENARKEEKRRAHEQAIAAERERMVEIRRARREEAIKQDQIEKCYRQYRPPQIAARKAGSK